MKEYVNKKLNNNAAAQIAFYTMSYQEKYLLFKYQVVHVIKDKNNYNFLLKNSTNSNIDEFNNIFKNRLFHSQKELTKNILVDLIEPKYRDNFTNKKDIIIEYENIEDIFKQTFLQKNIVSF